MPKFTVLSDVQQALYEALREEPYAAQPAPERVVREFYRMARSWHHARQTALNNHEIKNLVEIRHASAPLLNAWFIHQLAAYQYMEECFYTCNQDPVMKDDTSFVEMNIALLICHKEWCKLPDSIFRVSAKPPQFFAPAVFLTHLAILKENTGSRKQTNGLDFVQKCRPSQPNNECIQAFLQEVRRLKPGKYASCSAERKCSSVRDCSA